MQVAYFYDHAQVLNLFQCISNALHYSYNLLVKTNIFCAFILYEHVCALGGTSSHAAACLPADCCD